jgi:hypothetical protein
MRDDAWAARHRLEWTHFPARMSVTFAAVSGRSPDNLVPQETSVMRSIAILWLLSLWATIASVGSPASLQKFNGATVNREALRARPMVIALTCGAQPGTQQQTL